MLKQIYTSFFMMGFWIGQLIGMVEKIKLKALY
jgi:hypothetical protein